MTPRFARAVPVLFAALATLASASSSFAQDGASAARARELFDQANQALGTGRFAEARDLLRESLALAPNVGSAFNLAVALRGTGEILEAVRVFDALLGGEHGALSRDQRSEAERLLRATRGEIAVLHVSASGAERIEIRIDGTRVGDVGPGDRLEHQVDPGEHVVTASAPRRETAEAPVTLDRGGSRRVELALEPSADARLGTLVVEASDPDDVLEIVGVARGTGTLRRELVPGAYEVIVDGPSGRRESEVELDAGDMLRVRLAAESSGVLASPWFWGGVAVVVIGLAVGGVLLFGESEDPAVTDPVYGIVTTLRAPSGL
jgi:hypothetical protein